MPPVYRSSNLSTFWKRRKESELIALTEFWRSISCPNIISWSFMVCSSFTPGNSFR